ncbi:hypothetical protein Salat_2223300 [Sesamum alatum]|uniref:Uncharacterized protein n=1 Tax=Sesamum alatum TaxID=300844 RepID=A0AAE1XU56_9LAMI|nr:hypothetical protein Salat_2223300 [Sesamum alatum]
MEAPQKTWNHHEKKKMVIKIGAGGVGAVVLLGGALATAALASAFVVGKKGWSSSKDSRRRCRRHQSPPPEMKEQDEQDEANKGQQFVTSHVYDHPSNGPAKEVESNNNSGLLVSKRSLTLDEKPRIEIDGGKPAGDAAEASEEILCSISPKKLENNAISAIVEEGFPTLDERLPFEAKNMMHESDLTKEDFSNEIPEESKNSEQIHIEEVGAEREAGDDVEIEEINRREACVESQMQPREEENIEEYYDQEEIEVTKVENAVEGNHIDQKEGQNVEEKELEDLYGDSEEISEDVCEAIEKTEEDVGAIGLELSENGTYGNQEATGAISSLPETIASEIHSEDGEKTLLPMFESPVAEQENVNRDEEEGGMPTKIVEIIQEDNTVEGSQDDQTKYIEEEQSVKEQEKIDQPDDGMIQEKREELGLTGEANQSNLQIEEGEQRIPCENKEENACADHPIPTPTENREFGVPVLKEELISSDATNEDVAESLEMNENTASIQSAFCQPKDSGDDVESNIEKEVEEELISPENNEAANEQVSENVDVQLDVDDLDRKTVEEVEDSSATINTGIAAAKEVNENNTSIESAFCQPKDSDDDVQRNIEKEAQEELISPENTEATTEDFTNEEVAGNVEVDENKTSQQLDVGQPKQHEDDVEGNTEEEVEDSSVIIDKGIVATKDDSITEMNEDDEKDEDNKISEQFVVGQPKQHEDDVEGNTAEEDEDSSVIIDTGIVATKDDSITEMNEDDEKDDDNKISEQFVAGQPKQHEDDVEGNTAEEDEDSSVIIDTGIAATKDDSIVELNEDDEKETSEQFVVVQLKQYEDDVAENTAEGVEDSSVIIHRGIATAKEDSFTEMNEDDVKDFHDETYSSDEADESSVETGDSSTESNSDAVWPAESRQEASRVPQQVKLIYQEVEGKIQEDKAGREGEHDFQQVKAGGRNSQKGSVNFPSVVDRRQFLNGKGEPEKSFIKKYVAIASRRMMLIAALSVISSLSCSWFFGLSSVKLCLIVFLTMVLAKIHAY